MQLKSTPEPSEANDRHRPKARSGEMPRRKPVIYRSKIDTEASQRADDYFKQQKESPIIELSPDRVTVNELAASSVKALAKSSKKAGAAVRIAAKPAVAKAVVRFKQKQLPAVDVKKYVPYLKDRRVQAAMGVAALVVVMTVLVSSLGAVTSDDVAINEEAQDGVVQSSTIEIAQPDFEVAAPQNQTTTAVKYDPTKNVASTAVAITGVQATLSQQLIDTQDQTDAEFLIKVAQSFGLSVEIQSEKGGVFIGSNSDQQVTTAAFIYQDFLFFVRSSGVLDDVAVIDFVNTLE